MSASPRLHFIGRDTAAPERIVAWCREQWQESLPHNLIFCVPTSLALRRLRDALTATYGAFHGVRIILPASLPNLFTPEDAPPVASATEMLQVWNRVFEWLHDADTEETLSAWLFPGEKHWLERPAARYAVAERFIALRATLVEAGLDFEGVSEHPETKQLNEREQCRWQALAALECKARELLAKDGLSDPADLQLSALRVARPREADWHLVMACVPDFMPALTRLIEHAPHCDILVQANPDEAGSFSSFGLPLPEKWAKCPIPLPDDALVLAETPAEEAKRIDAFLSQKQPVTPSGLCLGILNRETMPALTTRLEEHGVTVFEPEPVALSSQPPALALIALEALLKEPTPRNLCRMLTLPEIPSSCGTDYATLRSEYDQIQEAHCPSTLEDFLAFSGETSDGQPTALRTFLVNCKQWASALRENPVKGARSFLSKLYEHAQLDPETHPLACATFEALRELFDELDEMRVSPSPTPRECEELLLRRLRAIKLNPARTHADCAYEGRQEILWSPAPVLIMAGLEEGIFPDTTFDDAFLPNDFRRRLGLRSDQTRLARDAYILSTAVAMRQPENLCLLCSRTNARGEWLKPSRLFFQCTPEQRKRRAKAFFSLPDKHASSIQEVSSALAFKTNPASWRTATITRVSASDIRLFLTSPLEYWLASVLRLRDTDLPSEDLSRAVLGTIVHDVLSHLRDYEESEPSILAHKLCEQLDRHFAMRYGDFPEAALLIGKKMARARIVSAVDTESASRRAGWQTLYTEKNIQNVPRTIQGKTLILHGRIDRIDRNTRTGAWRIIDYKTASSGADPNGVHYSKNAWKDFQLPLYRLLVRHALNIPGDTPIETAFFTLPESQSPQILPFKDLIDEQGTLQALDDTLAQMIALGSSPIPPGANDQGSLLGILTAPTAPQPEEPTP